MNASSGRFLMSVPRPVLLERRKAVGRLLRWRGLVADPASTQEQEQLPVCLPQGPNNRVTGIVSVEPRVVEQEPILLMDGHALPVERVVDHEPPHAEVERRLAENHVVAVATTLVVIALDPHD